MSNKFLGHSSPEESDICSICHKPIVDGEARYTLGEFKDPPVFKHYECHQDQNDKLDRDLRRAGPLGSQLADMFKRLKF